MRGPGARDCGARTSERSMAKGLNIELQPLDGDHLRAVLTWREQDVGGGELRVEVTAPWFERMRGAQVLRSMQEGKPRIDLKLGGANIFIAPVAAGDGVNSAPTTPYQGLDHFGLAVSGIDAIAADLKAKGVEFTKEPTTVRPGVRICFIRAPEGVSIELLERTQ